MNNILDKEISTFTVFFFIYIDALEANEIKLIQPTNINRIGVPSIKALSDDQLQVRYEDI